MAGHGLYLRGSGLGQVTGFCEHDYEHTGYIHFLD